MAERRAFWCSFWSRDPSKWEYHGPWWISGERYPIVVEQAICAAVMATDAEDARRILLAAHDDGHAPVEWRFVEAMGERPPFADRFRRADWMKWPWPEEGGPQ